MKKALFTFAFFVSFTSFSQSIMTIAATIVDGDSGEPIEFVNIGFVEKGIGTVSSSEGNFSLTFDPTVLGKNTPLQISSIGYKTISLPLEKLGELISYKVKIYLQPVETELGLVVVSAAKRQFERLGSATHSKSEMGYWRNKDALGGELATRIEVKNRNTRLHDLRFNILENESDSLLVRVNIYDYHKNRPGKNLLNKNIFHVITKKSGMDTISLKEHNIVVNDDIIVSLELVQVYGDAIYLAVSTTPYGGTAFRRDRSQDRWDSFRGVGLGFELLSSYSEVDPGLSEIKRIKPEKITVYWDASLGMQHRNLKEELEVLSGYIKATSREHSRISVNVVRFNSYLQEEKEFEIIRGRDRDLLTYLEQTFYLGTSDFSEILKKNEFQSEVALLFTDGTSFGEAIRPEAWIPVFCVNSMKGAAHSMLSDISFNSGGHYINLTRIMPKDALAYMLDGTEDNETYTTEKEIDARGLVHGVVYNDAGPVEGAMVRIRNTYTQTRTGNNGMYRIKANAGDVLEINALGMLPKDTLVGGQNKIHIPLKPDGNLLDEVLVSAKREKKSLEITPFGEKNSDAVGVSMAKTITKDDITENHTDIAQLLNWGVGVEAVAQDMPQNFKYRFRKFKFASFTLTTYAAIVVDGVVYDQNIPTVQPPEISPQQIERITFLETAASTIAYGSAAAYGAIVIETKNANRKEQDLEKSPAVLATIDNHYEEQLPTIEMLESTAPKASYLTALENASSFEEAKEVYRAYLDDFELYPIGYMVDSGRFFMEWDDAFGTSVLFNIVEIAPDNGKALRALAYTFDALGKQEEATRIYERILTLEPGRIQSYLDLAVNYKAVGKYEAALQLYLKMYQNSIPNIDFNEVAETVINELEHLVAHHKSKISYDQLPKEFVQVGFKRDIRMVFEWSDAVADFELQFVNPENKYFTFTHDSFHDLDQLKKEVANGYSIKEFVIDDAEPGKWLINLKYLGDIDRENPTFLKYTLYKNFGLPNESSVVKVIKFQDYKEKVTLDTFLY